MEMHITPVAPRLGSNGHSTHHQVSTLSRAAQGRGVPIYLVIADINCDLAELEGSKSTEGFGLSAAFERILSLIRRAPLYSKQGA